MESKNFNWVGQAVLVTGGTGFMGKLLVKKLLDYGAEYVISYSRRWNDSEQLARELNDRRLITVNGDVRDKTAVDSVMRRFMPDSVIHAAAYKSVPSAQANAREVSTVNFVGTMNVVDAAVDNGVRNFCLISTDKACAGVNAYGKSKALAEAYISSVTLQADLYRVGLRYFSCRYGNVVGSTGSVFGIFKNASVYPVTDPSMTRFWFRKNSAAEFVLDSFGRAKGGEIFVPYLSSSTMLEFAEAWQEIYDRPYRFVGIRPGEKLHEKMISDDEVRNTIWYPEWNVFAILPDGYELDCEKAKCEPVSEIDVWEHGFNSHNTRRYTKPELVKLIREYLDEP